MTLKLKPDPTFWSPVELKLPGGKVVTIQVEFVHMNTDEFESWRSQPKDTNINDAQALMVVVKGWKEVDAEFNEESVAEFLKNYHGAGRAIAQTFVNELLQVRLGN